mmetsp:Transcript_26256/g.73298  ORF Transcript_26256/g.73298 Transcript_26256/m.73298 type:complete len:252 (-) Transcript_26256:173-928(-)
MRSAVRPVLEFSRSKLASDTALAAFVELSRLFMLLFPMLAEPGMLDMLCKMLLMLAFDVGLSPTALLVALFPSPFAAAAAPEEPPFLTFCEDSDRSSDSIRPALAKRRDDRLLVEEVPPAMLPNAAFFIPLSGTLPTEPPVWMRLARLSIDWRLWKSSDISASKLVWRSIIPVSEAEESPFSRASWFSWSREKPDFSKLLMEFPPLPSPANRAADADRANCANAALEPELALAAASKFCAEFVLSPLSMFC